MKIIASDYDGTLNHGGIDDKKREAIKRWRRAGNLFGLVSGRGADDLLEFPEKNNFECDFLLASSGAVILKTDGTILAESRCSGDLAKPLLKFILENGCVWASIHTGFKCIMDERDDECFEGKFTYETLPDIPYFNQISTFQPDCEAAERLCNAIRERFGTCLNPLRNGACIDIVSAEMNKAQGLYKLLEITGAAYDDMITVGDNINDFHMIAEFRSYAMENAVQSIKDIADFETPGIAELIEKELNE